MVYRKVDMIEIREILLRIAKGQSKRKIRKDLKVHGQTVNRYIQECICLGIDPLNCDPAQISQELCAVISKNVTTVKNSQELCPRDALLLPVKDKIEVHLKDGLTKTKIRKLLEREGITVTESSFLRFVKSHFSHLAKNITVRLPETKPGQYAQTDFGRLGKVWDEDTKRLKVAWAFVITLAFSRHMSVFITFKLDTRAVIEGCELAWEYFGGIPAIVIFDNLTPVIDKADRYNPRINKTFMEYAQHRGFVIDPTNSGHARGKPIIENGIGYVKGDFYAGENFVSKDDCQDRALVWCTNVAGTRIHGTTRKRPIDLFDDLEKAKLSPYDGKRYDTPYEANPKVHTDHHIAFRKSLYSLPTKYIGKKVYVKGNSALVKIYYKDELIKVHPRIAEGQRSTDYNDYPEELTPYTLRNANYQIDAGKKKHEAIGDYIQFLLSGDYPWHRIRSAQKVLRIADKYGNKRTADACAKAMEYGVTDVRRIERMLKNDAEKSTSAEPETQVLTLFETTRFTRDGDYFKNYNR